MARRSSIATPKEVQQALTRILRGEDEARPGEVLKAAEMLGKIYGLFGGDPQQPAEAPKIFVDIPAEE